MRDEPQARQRHPVRVRNAVPPEGFGRQFEAMHAWLDEICGSAGWGMAPAGIAGVVNDAVALYFEDAALAHAFIARFCCGYRVEAIGATPRRRRVVARRAPDERSWSRNSVSLTGLGWRQRRLAPHCSTR
jgi:hypothetical protein